MGHGIRDMQHRKKEKKDVTRTPFCTPRFLSNTGFTMMELLVTVAIVSIIAIAGFASLGNYRNSKNITLTLDEIAAVLQGTQKRAITQENGSAWGVRLTNTTSSDLDHYEVFQGISYATSGVNQKYQVGRDVRFSEPNASSAVDIVFQTISGKISESKIISLISGRGGFLVGNVIINTLGRVTTRLEEGLVGYWHLDEESGTFSDASGNGNTGVGSGTLGYGISGKAGKAVQYSGDDKIAVNHSASLMLSDFSYGFWYKGIPGGTKHPITKWKNTGNNVFNNYFSGSNFKCIYTHDGNSDEDLAVTSASVSVIDDAWHLIFCTLDDSAGTARIYIDGQLSNTETNGSWGGLYQGTDNINIGGVLDNTDLVGTLDEIRIYNRALSADEILKIYNDTR